MFPSRTKFPIWTWVKHTPVSTPIRGFTCTRGSCCPSPGCSQGTASRGRCASYWCSSTKEQDTRLWLETTAQPRRDTALPAGSSCPQKIPSPSAAPAKPSLTGTTPLVCKWLTENCFNCLKSCYRAKRKPHLILLLALALNQMTVTETNVKWKQKKKNHHGILHKLCQNILPNFLISPNSINTLLLTTQVGDSPQRTNKFTKAVGVYLVPTLRKCWSRNVGHI